MTSTQTPKKGFPFRLLVIVVMATIADALLSIQVAQWSYAWLPVPASTAAPYAVSYTHLTLPTIFRV